jgi:hypothetical protein
MGTVCKESIRVELSTLSGKIQRISEWMDKHKTVENE